MNEQDLAAMRNAHRIGRIETIQRLLEKFPELEACNPEEQLTWLHVAAKEGHLALVEFWLDRGWDVNLSPPDVPMAEGVITPLQLAKGAAMTRLLLGRGAHVDACHCVWGTALHRAVVAARGGQRAVSSQPEEQLSALLEAGADTTIMDGDERGRTPLALAKYLEKPAAVRILQEAGAPLKGRRLFVVPKRYKSLDLRNEFADVYEHIASSVRAFPSEKSNVLSVAELTPQEAQIHKIFFCFDFVHHGWFVVVFDARPVAENDGEWNRLTANNALQRPRWLEICNSNLEGKITITKLDGTKKSYPPECNLAEVLGEFLRTVVETAQADELFAALPCAVDCQLVVDDFNGEYCWSKACR